MQDCGHDAVNDEALFNSSPRLGEPPVRAPAGITGLAFDERMTMHAEQSSSPHPERPDRIRAVIARLQASGLAGMCAVCSAQKQPTGYSVFTRIYGKASYAIMYDSEAAAATMHSGKAV